jgi:hypothetical protein
MQQPKVRYSGLKLTLLWFQNSVSNADSGARAS